MRSRFVMAAVVAVLLSASLGTAGAPAVSASSAAASAVITWNAVAIEAIHNAPTASTPGAGNTPIVGALHTAMVQLAVFDALASIVGGYEPYLDGLTASPTASQPAAVATAAHHVLVAIPGMPGAAVTRLDGLLADVLADIPDGADEDAGSAAGGEAAATMLADRATDGRFGAFRFSTGTQTGQWRGELPGFALDPNAWVARVRPFTLRSTSQFRTEGPLAISSAAYAAEFDEVKRLGRLTNSERTPEQQALTAFFVESPLIIWSRMFRGLQADTELSAVEWARLFGLLSAASADAAIGCWDDKARWSFWRPITAIRMAADDGNPATVADPDWLPLAPTPPYPDHPSGFNCLAGAGAHVGAAFFGTDRMTFTLHSNPANADRQYHRFTDVLADTIDVRIFHGLHFRTPDEQGAHLGKRVGKWVTSRFLEPTK
jgi:hypothetical protein